MCFNEQPPENKALPSSEEILSFHFQLTFFLEKNASQDVLS